MPILYRVPYRAQFFEHVPCDGTIVPVRDYDAYVENPEYRWAYNKLIVAEKQGLRCSPHGVAPSHFPIFSKPVYNLNAMGAGSRALLDMEDYLEHSTAGHMWSELLVGDHLSIDMAVFKGEMVWFSPTRGHPLEEGTFDYWDVNVPMPESDRAYLADFVQKHFGNYSGMLNAETIGGKIIEVHLRFTDQWPDLYPAGFVEALVSLYRGAWRPSPEMLENKTRGYSVVLFGPHGRRIWNKPSEEDVQAICQRYNLSSIHLPFLANQPSHRASMPPGGFRLACLNGHNFQDCTKAREELAVMFRKVNPPDVADGPTLLHNDMESYSRVPATQVV